MITSIDVVCVNWNTGTQLHDCIESIVEYSDNLVSQIIVVDNGSTDGSDTGVDYAPNIKIIRTGENLGFGRACNLGAQHASSEYILFLNPDSALYAGTLSIVLACMESTVHKDVGICGVQLHDESGRISRSCSRFPTVLGFVLHAFGLDMVWPHLGRDMHEWDHSETRLVDQVIGAFFFVRRDLFARLNGFDERFFLYFEEVDFAFRAKLTGWSSMYISEAQAFHAGGGSSEQIKARRLFLSLRSRFLYATKHFSWFGAAVVILASLVIEPLSRLSLAVFRRSWDGVKETLFAYGMLWRWLPQWVFKGVTR